MEDELLFDGTRTSFSFCMRSFPSFEPIGTSLLCALAVLAAFNLADRVLLSPFVTDAELVAYYRQALFFAFPSLYEGFGIPILEAFTCGCPVAASNRSSLPEVAGEAALFFDPEDEESIADTVRRLILSEDLRNKFRDAGQARARQFSWEATAAKTLTVYRQACQ